MIQRIPLKDLCSIDITDGTHKTPTYADSGYIFLSSKNVTSGEIDWDNVMYIPEELHKELYQRLAPQKDDILLAKNGTTGVAALVDREEIFDIYVSLALIRPDKNKIIPKYLLYAINSESSKRYFDSHLKGVGVPNLHLTHIRETPISVPDFHTQEEIIKRLDKVSDLIAKRRQQLDKLDLLVKARFVEMFGDPIKNSKKLPTVPMGERFYLKAGITTSSEDIHEYEKNKYEIPCYGGNGIRGYVREKNFEGNYPIIGRQGALCGNVQYASGKFHATEHAVLVTLLKGDNPIWVYFMLKLMDLYRYHTGAAQPGLAVKTLNTVGVIVADKELQNQFADFFEKVKTAKSTINESVTKLETFKKALMQEYFE